MKNSKATESRDDAFFKYMEKIHPEIHVNSKQYIYLYNCWNAAFDYMKIIKATDSVLQNRQMNGRTVSRKEFFSKFIETIEQRIRDSATVTF